MTYSTLKDFPIFDLVLQFGSLVALPYSIPLVLGMFIKRVPPWSAWTTVLVGFGVSFLIKKVVDPDLFRQIAGFKSELTNGETNLYFYLASVLAIVTIAGGWYLVTTLFYSQTSEASKKRDAEFFERMNTPLDDHVEPADEVAELERDSQQRLLLGALCLIYGGVIMLMALIPNDVEGRLCFLFCGGVVVLTGVCLRRSGALRLS